MRIPTFTFKNEAIWMVVFPMCRRFIGAVVLIVVYLLR